MNCMHPFCRPAITNREHGEKENVFTTSGNRRDVASEQLELNIDKHESMATMQWEEEAEARIFGFSLTVPLGSIVARVTT